MKLEINTNESATVILTPKGAQIYNAYWAEMPINCRPNTKKEGDSLSDELWSLFNIFGQGMYNGCQIPFKDNKLTLETSY